MDFAWIVSIVISVVAISVYIFHVMQMKKQKDVYEISLNTLTDQEKQAYVNLFPRIVVDVAAITSEVFSTNKDDIDYQKIVSKLAKTDFITELSIWNEKGQIVASTDLTKCDTTLSDETLQEYKRYIAPALVENSNEGKTVKVVSLFKDDIGGIVLKMDIAHI